MPKPLSPLFMRKAAAYHRERLLDENGGDPKAALRALRREARRYAKEDPEGRRDLLAILDMAAALLRAPPPPPKKRPPRRKAAPGPSA
jgi:hypothetical protein